MVDIIRLRLPRVVPCDTSNCKGLPGPITSQKHLKALRRHAVPPGGVLNPYGMFGNTRKQRYRVTWFGLKLKPALREEALKRNRIKMQQKKAIQLELHELQALARENATAAMQVLIEIAKNKRAPEATRIAASAVILDRGYGKASQVSITASVTNGKADNLDSTELDKRISRALKRVEDLTNRTPKAGTGQKRPVNLRLYN